MPPIVANPDDVSTDWLTEVLKHSGHDGVVGAFTAQHVGTGQVGDNVRFELDYASGTGPRSIIGKFASRDPVSRATGIAHNTYVKEVRFYREVKPTVAIRTPEPLFAVLEPATQDFCIMMEDLAPAVQGDQIAGCSIEQARVVVAELANLHAPRWNDPELDRLDWLARPDAEGAAMSSALYQQLFTGFEARYGHRLQRAHLDVAMRLGPRLSAWTLGYRGPIAIVHGDYRLDNMLFGGRYPVAIVDWQTFAIGAPASDLSYFIGAGLLPEDRRVHERELVGIYHDAITAHGITDYDLETCWRDYRRYSYSGLVMAVVASMIVGQTERGDAMFMAMASRHAEQALDLEAETLIES